MNGRIKEIDQEIRTLFRERRELIAALKAAKNAHPDLPFKGERVRKQRKIKFAGRQGLLAL